jgi:hypothetical protein
MRRRRTSWPKIADDTIKLGASAPAVIALRLAKLAKGGPAAKRESKRMVDEKMKAAFDATADAGRSIFFGKAFQVPARTIALYQKRVGNNLRRLLKKV